MVRQLHDGMQARVQNDVENSIQLPMTSGSTELCYGTNTVQHDVFYHPYAFQDCDAGFPIRYRFDVTLFNLMRLKTKSKAQIAVPEQCGVIMRLLQELQKPVWHLAEVAEMSGRRRESDLTLS